MNAIIESVAWSNSKSSGVNVSNREALRGYFETAAVSLSSARAIDPDLSLLLVTNTAVPDDVARVLEDKGVDIREQPFDAFSYSRDVPWYLAYYKLCALQSVVENEQYDRVLLLDTDTYIRSDLGELFSFVDENEVGLYDLDATASSSDRVAMDKTINTLGFPVGSRTFWGGEAILGSRASLRKLLESCNAVFSLMEECQVYSSRGDEFLLYAEDLLRRGAGFSKKRINPYIGRIWTGRYYTPCRWENLSILHLPAAKVYAFPRAYQQLRRTGEVKANSFIRMSGLRPSRRPFDPKWALRRSLDILPRIMGCKTK